MDQYNNLLICDLHGLNSLNLPCFLGDDHLSKKNDLVVDSVS